MFVNVMPGAALPLSKSQRSEARLQQHFLKEGTNSSSIKVRIPSQTPTVLLDFDTPQFAFDSIDGTMSRENKHCSHCCFRLVRQTLRS